MKRSATGLTKKEVLDALGIKNSTEFDRAFNKVKDHYGLTKKNINPFKEEIDNEKSKYEIPFEVMPLLTVLIRSFEANPFNRRNSDKTKISANEIVLFYQSLLNEIERLPEYEKYIIQDHPAYMNTLKEVDIMPKLSGKIAEVVEALEIVTKQERGDIMIYIYQALDSWLYNAYVNNTALEKARSSNINEITKLGFDVTDDTTVTQESIKYLDNLIAERIKIWLGLKGTNEAEIKQNVMDCKGEKLVYEEYLQLNNCMKDSDELRYFMELNLVQQLYDGQFEEHKQYVDELIKDTKERNYEKKVLSNNVEEVLEDWRKRDKEQQQVYIRNWKENEIVKLKRKISAYEETIHALEDDLYCRKQVETMMESVENYIHFNNNLQLNKRYEQVSNWYVGQLVLESLDEK